VFDAAEEIAAALELAGVRVLLDDRRGVSPGVKFNDSELIGIPTIMVVGKRLADGFVEVKDRLTGERADLEVGSAAAAVAAMCGR
jgi:prolyl-tRNA synthetase